MMTPARSSASIVYKTPAKPASDSDLAHLLKDIDEESKGKRAQERRRGVAKLQHHWRCARALSVGADGAAGRSDAASGSHGAAKTNKRPRFKFTSPEGESTRSLGPKRPKMWKFKPKEELDESVRAKMESEIDPLIWKTELERVTPHLKVKMVLKE